jgi:hypothetical protein
MHEHHKIKTKPIRISLNKIIHYYKKLNVKVGHGGIACNPSTRKAEAGEWSVPDQSGLIYRYRYENNNRYNKKKQM